MTASSTGLVAVVRRELRRAAGRPIYVFLTLVLPLCSFFLVAAIFREGALTDLPVAVVDRDGSQQSRALVRALDATPALKVTQRPADAEAGRRAMLRGDAYALVIIPEGFERDLLRAARPELVAYYNNQYLLVGGIVNRDLTAAMTTLSAGVNAQTRAKRGEPADAALAHVRPLRLDVHVLFNPYVSYLYYLVPGLLPALLQIFVTAVSVFAIGIELKEGTAGEWLACAGGRAWKAVAGKLLPYTAIFCALALFMNVFLYAWLEAPFPTSFGAVAGGSCLLVLAQAAMGCVLIAAPANLRIAMSGTAVYTAPAFAFAGVTFPVYAMPLLARIWAYGLPLTYYIRLTTDLSLRGAPARVAVVPMAVLAVFAAGGFLVAVPRLKRLMRDPRHWGKT
jgi:ABC-2 type transport system permease protein